MRAQVAAKHHAILCDMNDKMKQKKLNNLVHNINVWEREIEMHKFAVISGNGSLTQFHVGRTPSLGHEIEIQINKHLRQIQHESNGIALSLSIMIQEMCHIIQTHVTIFLFVNMFYFANKTLVCLMF